MPKAGAGYPYNFGVNSEVFNDADSETEAKTNSTHRVCPFLACTEHAQSLFFTHYVHTHRLHKANHLDIRTKSLDR